MFRGHCAWSLTAEALREKLLATDAAPRLFEPPHWRRPGSGLFKDGMIGAPFREQLRRRITAPLGLERTLVVELQDDLALLAPAQSTQLAADGAPRDVRAHYHPGWVSHGVIAATASDIVRFLDALFGARLRSGAALQEMFRLVPVGAAESGPDPALPLRPGRKCHALELAAIQFHSGGRLRLLAGRTARRHRT